MPEKRDENPEARDRYLLQILHPVPETQDKNCPAIEWMGYDLVHVPGIGEWKCRLQEYQWGDLLYGSGSENTDYRACNNKDHNTCPYFLKKL